MNQHIIDILLVEDNPDDVELTLEALSQTKLANRVAVVEDGVEAMAYLRKEGKYAESAIRPSLILLDLNMPRKDGRAVLQEIKLDQELSTIPVVVLTTSKAEEDIVKSYELHANCYISKPVDLTQFMKVVRAIDDFWFAIVSLPPKSSPLQEQ
jgi:CheY-like chemotaxis protein